MSSNTISVRVVANKVNRKIVYVEADKAFVDLLLCFLQLPLASVLDILSTKDSCVPQVGCVSNAYQSLCNIIRNGPALPGQGPSGLFYVVTDDLNILRNPNTMENLELLSKLKVTNMANLNKLETSITMREGLELLKCSFSSKTVLNLVFGAKVKSDRQAPESMLCWKQVVKVDSKSIPVRFLVKKHSRKILYMEAGKEFFEMLERFLNTPIAWLLNKFSMGNAELVPRVGSISNVYQSLYKLNKDSLLVCLEDIMNPTFDKARGSPSILISLLRGTASVVYTCSQMHCVSFLCNDRCPSCKDTMTHELALMDTAVLPAMGRYVYRCHKSWERCACVSYARSKWCTSCGEFTNREVPIVLAGSAEWILQPPQGLQGYVKNNISFIVSNELNILPASSINNVALLNKLMISEIHSFDVLLTIYEVLELLKISFISEDALNTAFGAQVDRRIPQASISDCECVDFILCGWELLVGICEALPARFRAFLTGALEIWDSCCLPSV